MAEPLTHDPWSPVNFEHALDTGAQGVFALLPSNRVRVADHTLLAEALPQAVEGRPFVTVRGQRVEWGEVLEAARRHCIAGNGLIIQPGSDNLPLMAAAILWLMGTEMGTEADWRLVEAECDRFVNSGHRFGEQFPRFVYGWWIAAGLWVLAMKVNPNLMPWLRQILAGWWLATSPDNKHFALCGSRSAISVDVAGDRYLPDGRARGIYLFESTKHPWLEYLAGKPNWLTRCGFDPGRGGPEFETVVRWLGEVPVRGAYEWYATENGLVMMADDAPEPGSTAPLTWYGWYKGGRPEGWYLEGFPWAALDREAAFGCGNAFSERGSGRRDRGLIADGQVHAHRLREGDHFTGFRGRFENGPTSLPLPDGKIDYHIRLEGSKVDVLVGPGQPEPGPRPEPEPKGKGGGPLHRRVATMLWQYENAAARARELGLRGKQVRDFVARNQNFREAVKAVDR